MPCSVTMMLSPATSTPSLGSKSISRHPWSHRDVDPKPLNPAMSCSGLSIFGISLGRPRRIFAQSLGIEFRLLFCLIRVFADLRDALVCRLNVHDKTLLIRRSTIHQSARAGPPKLLAAMAPTIKILSIGNLSYGIRVQALPLASVCRHGVIDSSLPPHSAHRSRRASLFF